MKLSDIINEAQGSITRKTRDNGEEFALLTDDAPEWMSELVHAAHGDMFPDDQRYLFIESAIDALAEADDDATADELESQRDALGMDTLSYGDIVRWLSSYAGVRMSYADEAADIYGDEGDTNTRLSRGMWFEADEVFSSVLASILAEYERREILAGENIPF